MGVKETINKIQKEFNENKNSHVFLFETDDVSKVKLEIKEIIKSILKADTNTSKQIDEDNYMELINIAPEGANIKKDSILELQERIKTKPILSDYMFYIIEHAELLNENAANKLLKTIEEPNDNVIGFLITTNTAIMLPTIKSRCQIEEMHYQLEKEDIFEKNLLKKAEEIIEIIETKNIDDYIIYETNEKDYIKENGKTIAKIIKDYYNTACKIEINDEFDSKVIDIIRKSSNVNNIILKAKYLNKTLNKLVENMNASLLLLKIVIELKEVK